MGKLKYYSLLSFVWLVSRLPFFILYRISDLMFVVTFFIVRYRKKTVFDNLRNAYPGKSKAEIRHIAIKFYRFLCDFMLESLKPYSISPDELDRRFRYTNPELMDEFHENGRDYALVSGHYGDWELNSAVATHAKRDALVIYRPLQNKDMDRLFLKIRSRNKGTVMTPMESVYRVALEHRNNRKPYLIWFISDQRPPRNNKFWTTFLNQPTPFFNGIEKLSRKLDLAVLYMHVKRVKRGFYEVTLKKLFDSVQDLPENAVILAFIRELEEEINKEPQYWLWSHKRWKYKPDKTTVIIPR
jgi:Kdo2-lipid IVA lauroyltransferase/acyltransferase